MKLTHVDQDKWRDAMKFLMNQGTGPHLTAGDQRKLRECLRGPFASGMTESEARRTLRDGMGWRKQVRSLDHGWDTTSIEAMERTAKVEDDHDCSLNIRGQWLEVAWYPKQQEFTYKWGRNMVPREVAVSVHATRETAS